MKIVNRKLSYVIQFILVLAVLTLLPNQVEGFNYCNGQIPYAPLPTPSGSVQTLTYTSPGNIFSSVIEIGFPFTFFGDVYTEIVIGTNGIVSFDTTQAGLSCPSAIEGIPNNISGTRNAILCPWQSLDTSGASIVYYLAGEAPNRQFVVSFENLLNFGSFNVNIQSVILYETSQNIDIVIAVKNTTNNPINSLYAVEGIQNAFGTEAFAVSGRNGTIWSLTNDSYRFSPMPSEPGVILGPTVVDPSSSQTYSILPVTVAASYIWTVPNGWTVTSDTGTSITVTVGEIGGTVTVIAINPCGMVESAPLVVLTNTQPILDTLPPTSITGKEKRGSFKNHFKFYNVLSWTSSPTPDVVAYNIYREGNFIAQVHASKLKYKDPVKRKNKTLVYGVTAVGKEGDESIPATVTIKDKSYKKKLSSSSNKN